ncbi:MAG: sensor domain-containing diguanylate cyclase, partial [Candidatus Eremiobacteraeota bacterium]|nr:sensor domain-containing diguanylate cyclase [Candidatus Eremiobacteraeota bacterium]
MKNAVRRPSARRGSGSGGDGLILVVEAPQSRPAAGRILYANQSAARLTGYKASELVGQSIALLARRRTNNRKEDTRAADALRAGNSITLEDVVWRKDGTSFRAELTVYPLPGAPARRVRYASLYRDVTAKKKAEQQLAYLSHHDPLTGLPNRSLLEDRLTQMLGRAGRSGELVAVLYANLDHFKDINSSMRRADGDQILQTVGARLRKAMRAGDTSSRIGGDEFGLICSTRSNADEITGIAARLMSEIAAPIVIHENSVFPTASVGISLFPVDGQTAEELISKADAAMRRAKESGRNTYRFYTPDIEAHVRERHELRSALRLAIDGAQFIVHYQPIF